MKKRYDVVIIGSGFGGSVTACRLAKAGRSVCILEKGKRWQKEDFPRSTRQFEQAIYSEESPDGFLEMKVYKGIDVLQGIGVGGGSLHYFGVTIRPKAEIFEGPEWPTEITRESLDPYFAKVEEMLEAKPIPKERTQPVRTEAFFEAARGAGYRPELVNLAIHIDRPGSIRKNPITDFDQTSCDYNSNCLIGCRLGAKNSLDQNYLPLAESSGAEIHTLHTATKIEPVEKGYRVNFRRLTDPENPTDFEEGSVEGERVIVAAGTLGSTELLLRCRDVLRTLPDLSPALGSRFSTNGDFPFASTLTRGRPIDSTQGPAITAGFDAATANHQIYIEDVGLPNPLAWFLAGYVPAPRRVGRLISYATAYLKATLRLGSWDCIAGRPLSAPFQDALASRMLLYLGMGTDSPGKMSLDGEGDLNVDWSGRKSRKMFSEMEAVLKKMSRQLGGKYLPYPLWRWPFCKTMTAHPLGGCPMGNSPEGSVTNPDCEVWGYPGLYVADGSVVPASLAANPSATIAALAERTASRIIGGQGEKLAGEE